MANIDPFGRLMESERWIAGDKLRRQQAARQNALQDIQTQSAQLGLEQKQGDAAFRNMLATNPQQARTDFKLRYDTAYPQSKAGAFSNIKEGLNQSGKPAYFGIPSGGSGFVEIPGAAPKASVEDKNKVDATAQKQINVLRSDVKDIRKSFNKVEEAKNRIDKIGKNATAASDMALIFNYMKMLDPGSTVREGEFATAQNATGVPGRISNIYNQMMEGTRLNPDQRSDFLKQADDLFVGQRDSTDDQIARILDQGVTDNVKGSRILGTKAYEALVGRIKRRVKKVESNEPEFTEGATATHPDGRRIIYRNGKWEGV